MKRAVCYGNCLFLVPNQRFKRNNRGWLNEMTAKEKEIFDLATDIDFAPLSVQLSLEDRKILANALLMLGYKKVNLGENHNE